MMRCVKNKTYAFEHDSTLDLSNEENILQLLRTSLKATAFEYAQEAAPDYI